MWKAMQRDQLTSDGSSILIPPFLDSYTFKRNLRSRTVKNRIAKTADTAVHAMLCSCQELNAEMDEKRRYRQPLGSFHTWASRRRVGVGVTVWEVS
jgi:hypothetical protein